MSAFSDFMTQSSFWWGTGAGAILASTAGGILAYVSKHKSDTRTFENDKDKDERQAARENKARNDAIDHLPGGLDLYSVVNELRLRDRISVSTIRGEPQTECVNAHQS